MSLPANMRKLNGSKKRHYVMSGGVYGSWIAFWAVSNAYRG
jgi:hypothetical protein